MRISASEVELVAQSIIRSRSTSSSNAVRPRVFLSLFGVTSNVVSQLWNLLENQRSRPKGFTTTHLLWTMCFLKVYGREETLCTLFGCDEKTMRKWVWIGLTFISDIESLVRAPYFALHSEQYYECDHSQQVLHFYSLLKSDQVGKQVYAR